MLMQEIKKLRDGNFKPLDAEQSVQKRESSAVKKPISIQPMTICLHGRHCEFLDSRPGRRPLCGISGIPIFDLVRCPEDYWRKR